MYIGAQERVKKLSLTSKVPCTVHLRVDNEEKVACGKRAKGEYVEEFELASTRARKQWEGYNRVGAAITREQVRYWYGWSLDPWVRRMKYYQHAGGVRVTLCATCKRRVDERIAEDAAQQLKAERVENTTTVPIQQDEFKDRGGRDGMLPPPRPVGTEGMTGHLDDGSKAGVCETSAAGFRTTFLPWIQCAFCLVQYDQFVEEGLMYTRGLYAESVK